MEKKIRSIDLTGQQFSRLTCIKRVDVNKSGQARWLTVCKCGKEKIVEGVSLRSGRIVSCGCYRIEQVKNSLTENLVNKRFGKLIAQNIVGKIKSGQMLWNCLCDCGNSSTVDTSSLLCNRTKSCGCSNVERLKAQTGINHPNWNINKTDDERKIERKYQEYYDWSRLVKERDNFICQCCKTRGTKLVSHHLENYSSCKEKRLDILNGITLCNTCHNKFHKEYGKKNNNKAQLDEFFRKQENE